MKKELILRVFYPHYGTYDGVKHEVDRIGFFVCWYCMYGTLFVLTFLIIEVTSSHWQAVQLFGKRSLAAEHGMLRKRPFSWSGVSENTSSIGKGTLSTSPP